MTPGNGPRGSKPVVLAQLTVKASYKGTATMNIAGRSKGGVDYHEYGVQFKMV